MIVAWPRFGLTLSIAEIRDAAIRRCRERAEEWRVDRPGGMPWPRHWRGSASLRAFETEPREAQHPAGAKKHRSAKQMKYQRL